jgi:hypothetical protein
VNAEIIKQERIMKALIVFVIIFGLIAAGCSTTTYLNLTENNRELVEEQLKYDEQDENVGAELTLLLMNGTEINGELLSIRDSTITICTEHSATEEELANLKYPINTVRNDEIQEMTIEGSNYVWTGLGIGIALGTGIGVIIGLKIEAGLDVENRAAGLGVIGFLAGAIAGSIVGYSLSTEEFILQEIPPGYDMSLLKPLSRYPDEEPEYLRAIE